MARTTLQDTQAETALRDARLSARRGARLALALGVALVVAVHARDARAQDAALAPIATPAPAAAPGAMSDAEVTARTAWIQRELNYNEPAAQRWFYFWIVSNTALTVGQGVLGGVMSVIAPRVQDRWGWQPGFVVGAVVTGAATVPMFIWPLASAFAPGRLRAAPPGRTPQERLARLRLAERLLRESAEAEDFGRSWAMHLIGVGLGVVSAAAVWGWVAALGAPLDTQVTQALFTLGFSILGNEAQVLTQSTAAYESWRIYRSGGFHTGVRAATRARPAVMAAPYITPTSAGLALAF